MYPSPHVSLLFNNSLEIEGHNERSQLTIPSQILNHPQTRLAISHRRIKIMLLAMLIHREPLKVNIPARPKLRLDRSGDVDGALHIELLDAAFHDAKLDGDYTRHLNRAAERNFAVALTEMQVADAEFRTLDVYRQEDFGSAREVLDVAVPAVFGAAGDCSRALTADLLFQIFICGSGMDILGLRRLGDDAVVCGLAGLDELAFALVPGCEDFGARCTAQDARVDEACETDAGDVA